VLDMPLIAWITLGLLVAVIATQIYEPRAHWMVSLLLGLVGAVLGGLLVGMSGGASVNGLDVLSLLAAVVGAIAAIAIHRGVRPDRNVY
jgi:uncharacterized membrane protein YeaQ/YmgE (transglycosylase-associated protein family)